MHKNIQRAKLSKERKGGERDKSLALEIFQCKSDLQGNLREKVAWFRTDWGEYF